MVCFDNNGKVIRENVNALCYNGDESYSQVSQLLVAQSFDGFVINLKLYKIIKLLQKLKCKIKRKCYIKKK
jgi:hypothetical protein